jgi:hypothetical protein
MAIGELGMTVDEFEALTPQELNWRVEAAQNREKRERERLAQLAAWIMSAWLTKGVNPYDLLGVPKGDRPTNWDAWIAEK